MFDMFQDIPKVKLKCNKKAQSGSWFARDNTANFTKWCKAFGFKDDCTFESEDLGKKLYHTSWLF